MGTLARWPRGQEILVVDDDRDVCEAVRDVLDGAGFAVTSVGDGSQAIEYLLAHSPPRLILLDLMMPEMDGWKFIAKIRTIPVVKDIPIILMTASGPHWGYPVPHVLRKPIGYNHLVTAVRNAIADSPGDLPSTRSGPTSSPKPSR